MSKKKPDLEDNHIFVVAAFMPMAKALAHLQKLQKLGVNGLSAMPTKGYTTTIGLCLLVLQRSEELAKSAAAKYLEDNDLPGNDLLASDVSSNAHYIFTELPLSEFDCKTGLVVECPFPVISGESDMDKRNMLDAMLTAFSPDE